MLVSLLLFSAPGHLLQLDLPVQGHQHQGEDGDVGRAHDDRLVQLAPHLDMEVVRIRLMNKVRKVSPQLQSNLNYTLSLRASVELYKMQFSKTNESLLKLKFILLCCQFHLSRDSSTIFCSKTNLSKIPNRSEGVVSGCEGDTEQKEKKVGDLK